MAMGPANHNGFPSQGLRAGLCSACQANQHPSCPGYRRQNHGIKPKCWCPYCRSKNQVLWRNDETG